MYKFFRNITKKGSTVDYLTREVEFISSPKILNGVLYGTAEYPYRYLYYKGVRVDAYSIQAYYYYGIGGDVDFFEVQSGETLWYGGIVQVKDDVDIRTIGSGIGFTFSEIEGSTIFGKYDLRGGIGAATNFSWAQYTPRAKIYNSATDNWDELIFLGSDTVNTSNTKLRAWIKNSAGDINIVALFNATAYVGNQAGYPGLIDFGDIPIECSLVFKNFFESKYIQIFDGTVRILTEDGTSIRTERNDLPDIKRISVNQVGNTKTIILTGTNEETYEMTWDSVSPDENRKFRGLSFSKNANNAGIPVGKVTNVSLTGSVDLFEVWGKSYVNPDSITVNIYQNSAEHNRVDKTSYLNAVTTLVGTLRESSSIVNPIITIAYDGIPDFNYVYIPELHRHYYIDDIECVRRGLYKLTLSVDVLMSYKDEIKSLTCTVSRQETEIDPLIVDPEIKVKEGTDVQVVEISNDIFDTKTSNAVDILIQTVKG